MIMRQVRVLAVALVAATLGGPAASAGWCVEETTVYVLNQSVTVERTCVPPE